MVGPSGTLVAHDVWWSQVWGWMNSGIVPFWAVMEGKALKFWGGRTVHIFLIM